MPITEVVSAKGRFGPLPEVRAGTICPGCGVEMEAGDRPALVNPSPPGPEDEGRGAYNAEVQIAHERCAYPDPEDLAYELRQAREILGAVAALAEDGLAVSEMSRSYWEALQQIRNLAQ